MILRRMDSDAWRLNMTFVYKGHNRDLVHDFLFGGADIQRKDKCLRAEMLMDSRTEGWVGIPHGGIGMGAIMELAMMLDTYPQKGESLYPLSLNYRMGGASVQVGDKVDVKVAPEENGAIGIITMDKDALPYLSATIYFKKNDPARENLFGSFLPEQYSMIEDKLIPLPYYRNCFVCGVERSQPGLKRRFYFLKSDQPEKIIVSRAGFDTEDKNTFHLFQRNNVMHPVAFLALIDETMGWAGFMASACAGVTVRIGYTFYRDIKPEERIVVFGCGGKIKGNINSRMLYWASGGAAVLKNDGSFEIVIAASGQWFGVSELTEQMKVELMPKGLTARAFRFAGSQ